MYKPCAITARPISGSGTRGDLGDGEWQVAEGGSNCRCGDRVRLIQGAQWFFQCCREADYADYTSVLDIHLHFHHNCLQSCPPVFAPFLAPHLFFSPALALALPQSYLIPSTILLSIHTSLSFLPLFRPPSTADPASR